MIKKLRTTALAVVRIRIGREDHVVEVDLKGDLRLPLRSKFTDLPPETVYTLANLAIPCTMVVQLMPLPHSMSTEAP
jgi:hypothetical protein